MTLVTLEIQSSDKIRNIGVSDRRFTSALMYLYSLVGVSANNYPDEASTLILIRFIKNAYPNLTLNEIRIAFELALKGDVQCEVNHYQSFSSLYLSGVVNAYIEYRRRAVAEINKKRIELEVAKPEPTKEQQEEINRRFDYNCIAYAYHLYLKNGEVDFGHVSINHVYERMEKDLGIEIISKEDKKALFKKVSETIAGKLTEKIKAMPKNRQQIEFRKLVRKALSGEDEKNKQRMIKEECRAIALRNFFQDHKNKELDMNKTLGLTEWLKGKI